MNRRTNLMLALGLAALLAGAAGAQDESGGATASPTQPESPGASDPSPKAGGPAGDGGPTAAAAAQAKADSGYDIRVKFDQDGAKGEIMCRGGRLKGDAVKYEKCAKDKLESYGGAEAAKRGVVSSDEAYGKLDPKRQKIAKKLAFYGSAKDSLKQQLAEAAKDPSQGGKSGVEYKKLKGVLEKVDRDYAKAAAQCAKAGGSDDALKCPQSGGEDAAEPSNPAPGEANEPKP